MKAGLIKAVPVKAGAPRPEPRPDERLSSYLSRVAHVRGLNRAQLLRHAQLAIRQTAPVVWTRLDVQLPAVQLTPLAALLGLPVERLQAMQLTCYQEAAHELGDLPAHAHLSTLVRFAGQRWFHVTHSPYCPECLGEDGAWQLAWQFGWTYCCPRHHRLLVSRCPHCQRPASLLGDTPGMLSQHLDEVPLLGRCLNNARRERGAPRACHFPLHTALNTAQYADSDLSGAPALLEAQREMLALLRGGELLPRYPAGAFFHDLRALCRALLLAGQTADLGPLPARLASTFTRFAEQRDADLARYRGSSFRRAVHAAARAPVPAETTLMAALLPSALRALTRLAFQEREAFVRELLSPLGARHREVDVYGLLDFSPAFGGAAGHLPPLQSPEVAGADVRMTNAR